MPDRDNSSPQFRAAFEAACKKVEAIGSDSAVEFWEDEAFDAVCEARIDGFEKGFLVGAAMALASPARAMQTTAAYYEACNGAPVILPLVALAVEGGTANA